MTPGRLGVLRGREPGPFGTMGDGTGADGLPWRGRNISVLCIKAERVYSALPERRREGVQRADWTDARAQLPARGLVGSGLAEDADAGCHGARARHPRDTRAGRSRDARGRGSAGVAARSPG